MTYILDVLPRLQDQYGPEDAGSLVALLCMNFLVLEAGDALYIPADGIHAYLSRDIVECMARRNNVLNTGFWPPADRDSVDLFADTLTFKAHSRDNVCLESERADMGRDGRTVIYRPPISDFDMLKTDLSAGESEELTPSDGPGILIVTAGKSIMHAEGINFQLEEGFILYIAPGVPVQFESMYGMHVYMAVA